jgi:hypothetical protein
MAKAMPVRAQEKYTALLDKLAGFRGRRAAIETERVRLQNNLGRLQRQLDALRHRPPITLRGDAGDSTFRQQELQHAQDAVAAIERDLAELNAKYDAISVESQATLGLQRSCEAWLSRHGYVLPGQTGGTVHR